MIPPIIPLVIEGIQLGTDLINAAVKIHQEWTTTGTVSAATTQQYLDRLNAATAHREQLEHQTIQDLNAI